MAVLWFIGVGLGDEHDLSERSLATLGSIPRLFAEEYTATLSAGSLERLSQRLGRAVERLDRAEVESGARILNALAEGRSVALLVAGDPFAATTHLSLRLTAEAAGHIWRYVPNASIHTAAASFLGLMHYRFGRTVSLPFPEPHFSPSSPLELIARNRSEGLHTLVLLDLRPAEGRYLTANEALRILGTGPAALPPDTLLAVVARVGTERARAWAGTLAELEPVDFGPPLHSLVVPAPELHFQETEALAPIRTGSRPAPTAGSS